MEGMEKAEIEKFDERSYKRIQTADILQKTIGIYANIAVDRIINTLELKKTAQSFIKELCTAIFEY